MRSLWGALNRLSDKKPSNDATQYIVAIAAVLGLGTLQWYLIQTLNLKLVYLMFFPAIMIGAWFGGWRPGVVATLLAGIMADYFFLDPPYKFWPFLDRAQLWAFSIFIIEGLFISALGEARLRSRHALLTERNSLEDRVTQRTQELTAANEKLAAQIIEREQAQVALLESESKFRSVVETASDAIVMSDADGYIIFWNSGAQKMFGYSAEEILYQPVTKLIPPHFQEAHSNAMQRLQSGAAPRLMGRPMELYGQRSDGSQFPIELSLAGWQTGAVQFYSGIMRDLSQRKQAEEDRMRLIEEMARRAELEAAEQHYRQLAEAIPQIVWTTLPDGSADYFNEHWCDFTGLKVENSLGWNWQSVVHPDDRERTFNTWKQAVKSGSSYEIEYRFRRHDGIYHWHLGRGVPLYDEAGRIYKWFGTCTDIDAQKNAGEASRFLAQATSRLTDSLNEAAIVRTLAELCAPTLGNWCIVDLVELAKTNTSNHEETKPASVTLQRVAVSGVAVSGVAVSGVAVSGVGEILSTDDTPHDIPYEAPHNAQYEKPANVALQQGPWRALENQRTEILRGAEIEILTQKGAILEAWRNELWSDDACLKLPCTVLCVPLIARGQKIGVLTIIGTDAEHNPDEFDTGIIEDLARNSALMIDNARLLYETQEANRAKDEFLAVLSHELRTPLTAILGWVQILRTSQLDDETNQHALATIERNTHAQVQLIEDLLDLSRIITGKLRLELCPLNLKPVIEAALDAVRPAAQAKEINLFVSLTPTSLVMGDAHRLQQVLWNLLSNAVKFTPKGGRIEVSTRHIESYVEIKVQDSGRGISAEFLPHVFERFRQADSSSTRQHGGLGLGLAIVRHVTELHGGTVHVESDGENTGTTFKIQLPISPLTMLPDTTGDAANSNSAPSENPLPLLSGIRVLLVDDERDTREMLGAALRRYGAQVHTCSTAQEALSTLPDWQPRVLVSDIGMPDEDGYDLIQQVRALSSAKGGQIPAMALTAYAREADRARALECGFNRHVTKPVDPVTLASIVADLAQGN